MTRKENFLNNILVRIKVLQEAYDYNKGLPEDLFESLPSQNGHSNGFGKAIANNTKKEYGANKKAVTEIIALEKSGLKRGDIIKRFQEMFPQETKASSIVTNALVGLANDESIESYKPRNKKGRGAYWRIKETV